MGMDVTMAVALKDPSAIQTLNARFRDVHDSSDCIVPHDGLLILGKYEHGHLDFKHEHIFDVNAGYARYYSQYYERGPCPSILLQLEWLRNQPEVLDVYYGSDHHDYPSLWTKEQTIELMFHWFHFGGRNYRGSRSKEWKTPKANGYGGSV